VSYSDDTIWSVVSGPDHYYPEETMTTKIGGRLDYLTPAKCPECDEEARSFVRVGGELVCTLCADKATK
jgi:hypothetical protein